MPKLIRDKIPEIMCQNGQRVYMERAEPFRAFLRGKLNEESAELYNALYESESDKPPFNAVYEEIADVLEVIDAIIKEYGLSKRIVRKTKRQKRKEKGSFDKKYVLLED